MRAFAPISMLRVVSVLALAALALAPMSATAESPAAPDVAFDGDFESGNLSQWSSAQCANTGISSDGSIARGTVNLTVRLGGQERYAARFNLPSAETSNACEVLKSRPIGLGTDDYYGLMVLFPKKSWREPSPAGWGLMIAQLGFQGIWGSPISLSAHAGKVMLVIQSGLCARSTSAHPGCAYSSGSGGNVKPMAAVSTPLALGVWHELIVHVHWSTDSSGVVEAWHRMKGETKWMQTVSLRGYPTVQWTPDRLSSLRFNYVVDKIGAYRGQADFPLSVWHDGFVRGRSFAAAAALP